MNDSKILELNRVEGFEPSQYLRRLDAENEAYLDVKWRKLWFRLVYPDGKIDVEPLALDFEKGVAVMQAKVYAHKNDAPEQFIAKATGQRFRSADEYGERFVECAETGAIGRALSDAGFGTQFCLDAAGDAKELVDSPITDPALQDTPPDSEKKQPPAELKKQDEPSPPKIQNLVKPVPPKAMTIGEAQGTIIEIGQFKGKAVGEVAVMNPGYVAWIIEKSNMSAIVKKAAKILMDAATAVEQEAS